MTQVKTVTLTTILFIPMLFIVFGGVSAMAQTGCINVESYPSRADIFIDNELVGVTPLLQYSLPAGCHTIRLFNATKSVQKQETVEITGDSCISLQIDLKEERGTLNVKTAPGNAAATIIRRLNNTPFEDPDINPGLYTLQLSAPGKMYKDSICMVEVTKDGHTDIDVGFEKDERYIHRTGVKIGLCLISLGTYIWSFAASQNDHAFSAYIGFGLGTTSLLSLGIVSLL